ncbi:uncharacterized protein PFL1_00298 [Pseudozyma flocculosa PF-1]|uniref:N-acetylglucosaminylphosphatidylinositol deacetylase n=1 Tax=Pseudozyma flocculosa TaxID=84751 RepID=A0A5C3ERV8_9BASI|nr:uncharacterized protein PFL1_00298 [Pseudozyma flocculosa PF-1]EPQ32101.1 hypothetical protein PFL1_00298 [Pseudozyma flocculosa PF-1]SPO34968.1 related to N-acetylglucosaminyl-phosphatidylinositol de-N-acetylase [Pseudozyma flocculosa]
MAPRFASNAPMQQTQRTRRAARRAFTHRRSWLVALPVVVLALLSLQSLLSGLWLTSSDSATTETLPRTALVLTAHPDDEVMFFAPTILALVGAGVHVFALCLSTGNADGLGSVRHRELVQAYNALGVPEDRVGWLDDRKLQDGMRTVWDPTHVAGRVQRYLDSLGLQIDALITFDSMGVSSHANHIACHQASLLLRDQGTFDAVYALHSPRLATKYLSLPSSLLGTLLSLPLSQRAVAAHVQPPIDKAILPQTIRALSSPSQYRQSLEAMRRHASQLVWFRYVYIVLSQLMYGNLLVLL